MSPVADWSSLFCWSMSQHPCCLRTHLYIYILYPNVNKHIVHDRVPLGREGFLHLVTLNREMSASKLKLPEFIQRNPAAWFYVCEAFFVTNKIIKEEEKYCHMVAALPSNVTELLMDVLCMEPVVGVDGKLVDLRYPTLKDRLMALYAHNEYEAFVAVLEHPALAHGQKPSTLLAALFALIPRGVKTDEHWLFKNLFLHKLPAQIRHACRTQEFPSLMAMALFADNVLDPVGKSSLPLHSVSVCDSGPVSLEIPTQCNVTAVGASNKSSSLCFYHRRFKDRAHRCEAPCTWKPAKSGNASGAGGKH